VAFQKYSLRNTTVFNSGFNNMNCIVIQIIVDNAFPNTIVFVGVFDDWLLEVSIELEDLYIYEKIVQRI
jgi:hypothetical protein